MKSVVFASAVSLAVAQVCPAAIANSKTHVFASECDDGHDYECSYLLDPAEWSTCNAYCDALASTSALPWSTCHAQGASGLTTHGTPICLEGDPSEGCDDTVDLSDGEFLQCVCNKCPSPNVNTVVPPQDLRFCTESTRSTTCAYQVEAKGVTRSETYELAYSCSDICGGFDLVCDSARQQDEECEGMTGTPSPTPSPSDEVAPATASSIFNRVGCNQLEVDEKYVTCQCRDPCLTLLTESFFDLIVEGRSYDRSCDDDNACTRDICLSGTQGCSNKPLDCSLEGSGNTCLTHSWCDKNAGCVAEPFGVYPTECGCSDDEEPVVNLGCGCGEDAPTQCGCAGEEDHGCGCGNGKANKEGKCPGAYYGGANHASGPAPYVPSGGARRGNHASGPAPYVPSAPRTASRNRGGYRSGGSGGH